MSVILRDENLKRFVNAFFKGWGEDIFSVILIPKRKKVTCFVNGFKQYEFDKKEVLNALHNFF